MVNWKAIFNYRHILPAETEVWTKKERDLAYHVYEVLRNIESLDFMPFVFGLVPVAWIYQGIKSGIIPASFTPAGKYAGLWSIGTALLIYAMSVVAINKLAVKKLQLKWIAELYQKMNTDKEFARIYDKLEQIDPYPDWRIRNTFLRLNKLF